MNKPVFVPGDILIPRGVDFSKWSVIACDQFSAQREYWDRVTDFVGGSPSTLNMIVPEAYLEGSDMVQKSARCAEVMQEFLNSDLFRTIEDSFIYVQRVTGDGTVRQGLVGLIDLDEYEYEKCNNAPIRASENTVVTRLPPRVAVRREAALELPHAMMLIDDRDEQVIEPLGKLTDTLPLLYDFTLMEDGGSIKGWQVTGQYAKTVIDAMSRLSDRPIQIVIGDGNHSLAAAKECWNEIKKSLTPEERKRHPAKYALAELNNVYDEGIKFEAIHRIVMDIDTDRFIEALQNELSCKDGCQLEYAAGEKSGRITVPFPSLGGMIGALQEFLDKYVAENGGEIDYIHDESAVRTLASRPGSVGLILPAMDKAELFRTVETDGVFPKKSFSIGHARDKRYYLECRRIKQ